MQVNYIFSTNNYLQAEIYFIILFLVGEFFTFIEGAVKIMQKYFIICLSLATLFNQCFAPVDNSVHFAKPSPKRSATPSIRNLQNGLWVERSPLGLSDSSSDSLSEKSAIFPTNEFLNTSLMDRSPLGAPNFSSDSLPKLPSATTTVTRSTEEPQREPSAPQGPLGVPAYSSDSLSEDSATASNPQLTNAYPSPLPKRSATLSTMDLQNGLWEQRSPLGLPDSSTDNLDDGLSAEQRRMLELADKLEVEQQARRKAAQLQAEEISRKMEAQWQSEEIDRRQNDGSSSVANPPISLSLPAGRGREREVAPRINPSAASPSAPPISLSLPAIRGQGRVRGVALAREHESGITLPSIDSRAAGSVVPSTSESFSIRSRPGGLTRIK